MNILDLIKVNAFPKDAAGFSLIPINGGPDYDTEGTVARVFLNEELGAFPLIGVGPGGTACQWDANGRIDPVLLVANEFVSMSDDEIEAFSLALPPSIVSVTYTLADEADLVVATEIEDEEVARMMAGPYDTILRVTKTMFALPDGVAGGIEMEPVEVADFV